MADTTPNAQSGGLGAFVQDLIDNSTLLVRQELALFKSEMGQTVSRISKDAVKVIVGGLVAYTGLLGILAAVILALALVWPAWLAALVVGGVVALIGVVLLVQGLKDVKEVSPAPSRTVESVGSTVEMIKEKV